jgi:rfaE bifunctional protein kinase chain/domain
MKQSTFHALTRAYPKLRIAVVGDFCLDRYLEIDPARRETSLETGLPVHNVVKVRSQPGGAGTILNNLLALGVGQVIPVGFAGEDGEGFELCRALGAHPNVRMDWFLTTPDRRTFTYCKPLVVAPGKGPVELNRLDSKNWTPTPASVESRLIRAVEQVAREVDAIILLDQVDLPGTGVMTRKLLRAIGALAKAKPQLPMLADSRQGLQHFPSVAFKVNRAEFSAMSGTRKSLSLAAVKKYASTMAREQNRRVFVTLAHQGIVGAAGGEAAEHVPALPVRGEIDVVGAGDCVTANLTAAWAAGATLRESLELANAASSIVIHQLGTTGTATVPEIWKRLRGP